MKNHNFIAPDITLGSDPELFIFSAKENRIVISCDLLGGSKAFPRPAGKDGFFVQEDNALAEFNIPPAKTKDEFITNINTGIELFKQFLPESEYRMVIQPSHKFMPEQLLHYAVQEFGCSPDFNAWLDKKNPSPEPPTDGLRSAGGHITIGYNLNPGASEMGIGEKDRPSINRHIIKFQDLFLAVPAMKMDSDRDRRRLYGKAGAFRHTHFGVEYRTLSSFWLKSKELIGWAWDQTLRAVDKVNNAETLPDGLYDRIRLAVDADHKPTQDALIEEYGLVVL